MKNSKTKKKNNG